APDSARDTAVDVPDLLLGQHRGVDLVVGPARVAAVDDDVAGGEQFGQLVDRVVGGTSRRHHHPDDFGGAVGPQRLDHRLDRVDVAHLWVAVEAHHGVPCATDPLAHVATHLAQADES